jgi:hypothetical protein
MQVEQATGLDLTQEKGYGIMRPRRLLGLVLLLISLATFGCAGMNTYQSSEGGAATMMDCNGDKASHYGTGCHPGH